MAAVIEVDRSQALAHRVRAQRLDRAPAAVSELAVWRLGLQDTPAGSAAASLANRLPGGADAVPDLTDARSWHTVWGPRGAPVVLRAGDTPAMAAALWPFDHADAVARLAGNGKQLQQAGVDALDALRRTAEVLQGVVTATMSKGEVSAALTERLPGGYSAWCRACGSTHVGDQLMRLAGLPGGARLVPEARHATLAPLPRWPGPPQRTVGAEAVVRAYLSLAGPAQAGEVAAFLGTTQRAVEQAWPEDLVAVRVGGRRAWLPPEDLDALLSAPTPEGVRLLARGDPWLLARDRALTVPERAHQRALWPVLGAPGAVLAGTEVVGTWRTKASGPRLVLTVAPFAPLPARVRAAVEEEAAHVARLRGASDLRVAFTEG